MKVVVVVVAVLLALAAACSDATPSPPVSAPTTGAPSDAQIAASKLTDPFGKPHTAAAPHAISADTKRDLVVVGSVSKLEIVDVLRKQSAHITNCANLASPPARGLVVVKLAIGGDGRVTQAQTMESSIGNSDVEDCITGAAKTWMFPEPKGGGIVVATVPFHLE